MNKLIYSICAGSVALAVAASAADQDNNAPKAKRANKAQTTAPATSVNTHVNASRNVNTGAHVQQQRTYPKTGVRHTDNNIYGSRGTQRYYTNQSAVSRANRVNTVNRNVEVNRNINRNVTVNRSVNRTRNVAVVNNWNSARFNGSQYYAFRNYHRHYHDRGWYNNYRVSFFFGSPYYWNSGYWYPAYGYGPGYSYAYDGPIYGYNNLDPQQVVVNVQSQLARDGYYSGPVDGQLGPMTRQALADFQADHGLAVTSAVDEPTLSTLGLV